MDPDQQHEPVTLERHGHVTGPFFHGTRAVLGAGDLLVAGRPSHFLADRALRHVYFAAAVETAVWGAELAAALSADGARGRVYLVEPTGPFEDDPNVTDQKLPGNPTRSFRSVEPLLVVGEVEDWEPHPPEVLEAMLASLERLRAEGRDVVID